MFEKRCPVCKSKRSKEHNFCPYCGFNIKRNKDGRDFGLLGKEDTLDTNFEIGKRMPFGFNSLFSNLIKQLDKQFRELDKEIGKDIEPSKIKSRFPIMSKGMSISISTATGKKPEIRVRGFGPGFENLVRQEGIEKQIRIPKPEITEEKARKLAKLPKEEAETKVRRLSNRIIYEISLPEVKNLKDVMINQLENSIEIKAFSKDKAYFKLLPINLPILNYKLNDNKLILELKAK